MSTITMARRPAETSITTSAAKVAFLNQILDALGRRGTAGATSLELSQKLGHDTPGASGSPVARALSQMHEAGDVARLTKRRGRYTVYVLPEFVRGRKTLPRGRHHCPGCRCDR